jgi:hypothetical protein
MREAARGLYLHLLVWILSTLVADDPKHSAAIYTRERASRAGNGRGPYYGITFIDLDAPRDCQRPGLVTCCTQTFWREVSTART